MAGIDEFMAAITAQESGGRPQVANERTGAHGLFQIMPGNWSPWAKEAGLGGNASKTPENQTKVARHKMQQYHDQYGSWDLVAAAWFGGPGAANALKRGDRSVLNRSDGNMTIGEYIKKMNKGMGSRVSSGSSGDDRLASTAKAVTGGGRQTYDASSMLAEMFAALSDTVAGRPATEREAVGGSSIGQSYGDLPGATGAGAMRAGDAILAGAERALPQPITDDGGGEMPAMPGAESEAPRSSGIPDIGRVTPGQGGVPKGLRENAARGAAMVREVFGFKGTIGGLGHRPNKSDHPDGNAIDVMTNDDKTLGQQVSDWFVAHREALGVKYVIFDQMIWSASNGWKGKRMPDRGSPTANHEDHPHVSFV